MKFALSTAFVATASASCTGTADPVVSGAQCYHAEAGALGLTEVVDITLQDFSAGSGHFDVMGSGVEGFTCTGKSFSKSGQSVTTDLSDCLPGTVSISEILYCSDADALQVKVKVTGLLFAITATAARVDCSAQQKSAQDIMWDQFKAAHGDAINGDEEERKAIFADNVRKAVEHNRKETGSWMGVQGPFAAMTLEEFQAANIRGYQSAKDSGLPNLGMDESVESTAAIDWSTRGAVTPVKNQGQCGSCWAFSTTGGLEGSWQIATGRLTSMSEQQFVDCDTGSGGCNGGSMEQAFSWSKSHAIATESSYAYTARDGTCKTSFTSAIPQGGVTGYKSVSSGGLTSALQQQPISVAIEADQSVFQLYSGGVITSGCGTYLDHGVLAVGVNSDGSIKVKNSWGTSWGANGYVNIATNQCGIQSDASYPVVSGSVSV